MVHESVALLNDGTLHAEDLERYPRYPALAEGGLSEAESSAWLRQHIKSDNAERVNTPRARYAR